MEAPKRIGRPTTAPKPAQKSVLNVGAELKVGAPPSLKERLLGASQLSARSLSAEMEFRLEMSFRDDDAFGGPRTRHLMQMLAEVAQTMFPDEADWLDNRRNWDNVLHLWSSALDARAPPAFDRSAMIAAARWVIDQLRAEQDPSKRDHLRQILLSVAISPQYPEQVRLEAAGAATMEQPVIVPAPEPITVEQQIDAGRRLIAQLATTTDSHRHEHLRSLLEGLATVEAYPETVREEFRRAAANPPPPRMPLSWSPSPSAPEEWRPEEVHLFEAAWRAATAVAIERFGPSPGAEQVAEVFADDRMLILIAKLPQQQTPATILTYRQQIERAKASSVVPPAPVTAESAPARSQRRRRSTRSLVARS